MVGIGTIQFHLSLQRHAVGQTALQAFINGIAGRVDIIIEELKHEVVARIGDGEVLSKHLIQAIVLALLWWSVKLEEITEGFQLHVEEIRKRIRILDAGKIYSVINNV